METDRTCGSCGAEIPPGGRFCTACGTSTDAPISAAAATNNVESHGPPRSMLPWAVAAGALVALLAMLLYPRIQTGDDPLTSPSGPPITGTAAPSAGGVDLASMTPREAADRLFNRVMQSVSQGDSAQAQQFLPMALAAYDRVETLDRDGRYHVAVLQLVNGDPDAARAQADTILADEPSHLFGLATAAQAETARGNTEAARDLYARFLEAYDSELARGLPEYEEHSPVLPAIHAEARSAVAP